MCLQYILVGFIFSIILPLLPSLLRTISTGFILLFSYMDTKYIHCIYPHSPFPCIHSLSTDTHPWKRLIFFLLPFFFIYKCIDRPVGLFEDKWMELESFLLSEVSQSQKIKNYMFSFIYGN
jgi:hypothetical protein